MKFTMGIILGFAIALGTPAGAAEAPVALAEPVAVHPNGTVRGFTSGGCSVTSSQSAEQYRYLGRPSIAQVREIRIDRMRCDRGDRRRTQVSRGPWMQAYAVEASLGR